MGKSKSISAAGPSPKGAAVVAPKVVVAPKRPARTVVAPQQFGVVPKPPGIVNPKVFSAPKRPATWVGPDVANKRLRPTMPPASSTGQVVAAPKRPPVRPSGVTVRPPVHTVRPPVRPPVRHGA